MYRVAPNFILLLAILIAGCEETVLTRPDLTLTGRPEASLIQPIAIAVVDDQADQREGDYATDFVKAICRAYPKSFKAVPAHLIPVQGRVSVKIRIRHLGAFFNKTKSPVLLAGGHLRMASGEVADWDQVVMMAGSERPIISGHVAGLRGSNRFVGWSGIAHLNVEVKDLRPGRTAAFMLPLAAERSTGNTLGYITAKMNSAEAWEVVGPRLARFLDAAVRKVAEEELSKSGEPRRSQSCIGSG